MKKKTGITKTLALVLTLGLLCSGLTGCGQTRNSGSAAESLMTESTLPESEGCAPYDCHRSAGIQYLGGHADGYRHDPGYDI